MDRHVSCSIVKTTSDNEADEDSQTSDDAYKHLGTARAGFTAHRRGRTASSSRTGFRSISEVSKAGKKGSKSPTDEEALTGESGRKERRFKKPWNYSKNDDKNDSKKEKKGYACCCCDRGKKSGCCCCYCKKNPACTRKEDKSESERSREKDCRSKDLKKDRYRRGRGRGSDCCDSDQSKESSDSSDSLSDRKSTKDRRRDHSCRRESFREGRHEPPFEYRRESPRELLHESSRELARDPPRESRRELTRENSRESRREPIRDLLREPPRECRREPSRESLREPTRDYRREPVKEYRREPEYRHEPLSEYRHETKADYRHEPSPEYRCEFPRDYRREPPREGRHELPREFRREPSRESRREPSSECRRTSDSRHETSSDSRRDSSREPSRDGHWDHSRERPSYEYHHSSRRSSGCHCKSSCCKCRFKSCKESETQPRRSCSGNRPSICSIRSSNCLPLVPTLPQSGAADLPRANSYVLIKCVPCTIQQADDITSKSPIKGASYQRPVPCPQRQLQIQSLAPPTIVPPPPLTLNRNPAAGQGLSLGPSYVPLSESNFTRPQPVLSLTAPTLSAGLSLPSQSNGQLSLGRQLTINGQASSLVQSCPKSVKQLSPNSQVQSNGQLSLNGQLSAGGQYSNGQPPSSVQFSNGQLGQSSSNCQYPSSNQLLSGAQYYSNQNSSGGLYSTNNQCSQSASPAHSAPSQQTSPVVQYATTDRNTPCGQYFISRTAEQNPSYSQQQGSSVHSQSSAVSLQGHSAYSSSHAAHREPHHNNNSSSTPTTNNNSNNNEDQSQQSYTPHPYQTLVMCTPCSPNCCSPQSPCGSRPCSSYTQFPPCGPQRACCTTHQVCEPCIPQPELRRHPHAHCRHPADFRGQPPEYRCPVSCTVRIAGCRLRTIHPYLSRAPCLVYSPSSCPCQNSKRFTDHCGAHLRMPHARYADDTVTGVTYRHPDSSNSESAIRHRHNAERTYAGHYYRAAHCRHQIVDNVMNGRNSMSRKQQPSPPPTTRTRAPRDTCTANSTANLDTTSEVDAVPVSRPSSAS